MCPEVVQATLLSVSSWTLDTLHDAAVFMLNNRQWGMGVQRETHEVSPSTAWLCVRRWVGAGRAGNLATVGSRGWKAVGLS